MPPKATKDKTEAEIRKLSKLEGNKICVDCGDKMPTFIDMTHKTFVCQKCSAIHRELQHKVKGISMTVFSESDVAEISRGGNQVFNDKYMALYTGREAAYPSGADLVKLKEFIQLKYIQKRWYSATGPSAVVNAPATGSGNGSSTKSNPVSNTQKPTVAAATASLDLLSFDSDPVHTPAVTAPVSLPAGFDPFAPVSSAAMGQSGHDPFQPHSSAGPLHPDAQVQAHHAPAAAFDPFGSAQPAFDPFGTPAPVQQQQQQFFDPFGIPPSQLQTQTGAPASSGFAGASSSGFTPSGVGEVVSPRLLLSQPIGSYPSQPFYPQTQLLAPVSVVPTGPMPFIQLTKPVDPSSQPPAPTPTPAAAPKVVLPGFSAFDDLAAPSTANPFDQQSHPPNPHTQPGYPTYPQAPVGHPGYAAQPGPGPGYPQGFPAGPGVGYPGQQYPGYAPQPQQVYSGYGPQGYTQQHPQQQQLQPQLQQYPPHGYAQQLPPGAAPVVSNNPFGPPTVPLHPPDTVPIPAQVPSSNPFGPPEPVPQQYAQAPVPMSAPAPTDPFSDMTSAAWGAAKSGPIYTQSTPTRSGPPSQSQSQSNGYHASAALTTPVQTQYPQPQFDSVNHNHVSEFFEGGEPSQYKPQQYPQPQGYAQQDSYASSIPSLATASSDPYASLYSTPLPVPATVPASVTSVPYASVESYSSVYSTPVAVPPPVTAQTDPYAQAPVATPYSDPYSSAATLTNGTYHYPPDPHATGTLAPTQDNSYGDNYNTMYKTSLPGPVSAPPAASVNPFDMF